MISLGIICCIFGFTALAEAKDVDAFKVSAMLLCALGVPTSFGALYVNGRVRALTEGNTEYLRTRDALFDVFVCTGALLIMLGFLFMIVGFVPQSDAVVLQYFGVMGCIQFVVGMFDLLFIRVWVRGSQPRTGRGNIVDVVLDLRYPVVAFESTCYEQDSQSTNSTQEVYEQDIDEPTLIIESLDAQAMPQACPSGTVTYLPAAPPTYEQAVGPPADGTAIEATVDIQFEPPPAYQFTQT